METCNIRPTGLADKRCKNLSGKVFGTLTVVGISSERLENRVTWNCLCKCGVTKSVVASNLIRGVTKSCGCQHHLRRNKNPNWKGIGDLSKTKWGIICNGAKSRNIPLMISIQDAWDVYVKQNGKCALSGLPLKFASLKSGSDETASLDRINSSRGYVKDNIQWVDKRVNTMKWDIDQNEFLALCRTIANHNSKA